MYDKSSMGFEFESIGKKGAIEKVVQFSHTGLPDTYNLGLGDKDVRSGRIDDDVISDNGDSKKVLATVARAVIRFFEQNTSCQIIAIEGTKSRTKLCQIGISNNLEEITKNFIIYGLKDRKWQVFERGQNYEAFLIKEKE